MTNDQAFNQGKALALANKPVPPQGGMSATTFKNLVGGHQSVSQKA